MAYLRSLPIDAILVTGDIADHGEPEEYKQARAALTAEVPVLVLPGNHDDRSNFRKVLLDQEGNAPINQTRMIGGALFALCDSSIPGRDDGMLTQETLEWLDALVTRTAAHIFIAMHHPPVALHNPLIDEIRLTEANQLTQLIERHPQVFAVLCGHAQTAAVWSLAGRPVLVAPGVVSTLRLPWTTARQLTWDNTLDFDDPPAVAFHVLDDRGQVTTQYRVVPA